MRYLLTWLGLVFLIACRRTPTSSQPPSATESKPQGTPATPGKLDDPCATGGNWVFDVQPSPGVKFADYGKGASEWTPPPTMQLDVVPPTADGTKVTIAAVLSNTGMAPIDVATLSGGVPGLATNPWNAKLNFPERPAPPPPADAPPPVEIYPYATRVTLPPGAKVRYTVDICLARYNLGSEKNAVVDWSFELWGNRRVGTSPVTLP